jgi:hypothetical protein
MRAPFHNLSRLFLLAACVALVRPAAAQHCWPSSLALLVHDEGGRILHPDSLDGYTHTPLEPDSVDTQFSIRRLDAYWKEVVPHGTPALYWWGEGDCRVDVDDVVLTRGGRVMRLRLNVRLDTNARPGPTVYVLDAPPFAEGTWELVHPLPPGALNRPAWVPADRWRRVASGGGR